MNDVNCLFGKPVESITNDDIQYLIESRQEETLTLELKASDIIKKPESICKEVSAFANSAGGILIIGVKAPSASKQNDLYELTPISDHKINNEWISQTIEKITPVPSDIHIVKLCVDKGNKWIFLISVPPSNKKPHMSPDNKYYQRLGNITCPMEHHQVYMCFNQIKKTSLIPSVKISKNNKTVTFTIHLTNDSDAICKYPFLILKFKNINLKTSKLLDKSNNVTTLNGAQFDYRENRLTLDNPNIVIHSQISMPVCTITSQICYNIELEATVAGDNMDTKTYLMRFDKNVANNSFLKYKDHIDG